MSRVAPQHGDEWRYVDCVASNGFVTFAEWSFSTKYCVISETFAVIIYACAQTLIALLYLQNSGCWNLER